MVDDKDLLTSYRPDLPRLVPMNRNLMWFPTSVLNSKSSFTQKSIKVHWESIDPATKELQKHLFEFSPMQNNPLPLAEHSKLFDILLALYSNNMFIHGDDEKDALYFRITDVAEIANRQYTDGFRVSLAETVYRYMRCVAFWQNAYLANGRRGDLSCTLIRESSLWDNSAGVADYKDRRRVRLSSPGRGSDKTTWCYVKFDNRITEVLHNGDTRLFLSEIIKSNLKPVPYIIYRYFYAFSDIEYVERSLSTLCQTFGFASRQTLFPKWFRSQLDEIAEVNLFDDYVWPEDIRNWEDARVRVKCKNFTRQNPIKDMDTGKLQNIDNLTNLVLLEYYLEFKRRSILSAETVNMLEFIERTGGRDIFYGALKEALKSNARFFK